MMGFGGASGSRLLGIDSFARANTEKFAKSITLFSKKCETIDFARDKIGFWKKMKGVGIRQGVRKMTPPPRRAPFPHPYAANCQKECQKKLVLE
jgi:hypothetical protein